jgi:hypothetical protein
MGWEILTLNRKNRQRRKCWPAFGSDGFSGRDSHTPTRRSSLPKAESPTRFFWGLHFPSAELVVGPSTQSGALYEHHSED